VNSPRLFVSPVPILVFGITAFAGWIAYDTTHPALKPAPEPPSPVEMPMVSMSVRVVAGEPPLQPGMSREIVERIIGPVSSEVTERVLMKNGVPVRRVNYRCLLADGDGPSGWNRVTVEFSEEANAQVVSHVSVVPLPEAPTAPALGRMPEE
jgi:hypothetical protein